MTIFQTCLVVLVSTFLGIGEVFYRTSLNWDLSAAFLIIRLGLGYTLSTRLMTFNDLDHMAEVGFLQGKVTSIHLLTSLLEYNCFTMVYQFLLYNKVNQLYIYICPHISPLLHLPPSYPPYPTPLGGHKAPS